MRLDKCDYMCDKHIIHLLPTVKVIINDYYLMCNSITIQFHFLIFNFRLRWIGEEYDY